MSGGVAPPKPTLAVCRSLVPEVSRESMYQGGEVVAVHRVDRSVKEGRWVSSGYPRRRSSMIPAITAHTASSPLTGNNASNVSMNGTVARARA
jgi:hypothetical protein